MLDIFTVKRNARFEGSALTLRVGVGSEKWGKRPSHTSSSLPHVPSPYAHAQPLHAQSGRAQMLADLSSKAIATTGSAFAM